MSFDKLLSNIAEQKYTMEIFEISTEYIQLNQLLKATGICENGAQANELIDIGKIKVNGKIELRRRNKLVKNDIVQIGKIIIKIY